jgi:hypothetical protein
VTILNIERFSNCNTAEFAGADKSESAPPATPELSVTNNAETPVVPIVRSALDDAGINACCDEDHESTVEVDGDVEPTFTFNVEDELPPRFVYKSEKLELILNPPTYNESPSLLLGVPKLMG